MHIITFLGNINHTADINLHLYTYHYNAMQFTNIQKSTYKHYTYSVCDVRAAQPSIFSLLMCTFTHIYNTEEIVKTTRYFSNVKQFLDRVLFYLKPFSCAHARTSERTHFFPQYAKKKDKNTSQTGPLLALPTQRPQHTQQVKHNTTDLYM